MAGTVERQLTASEAGLLNVQHALETADEGKLYRIRTRFNGLINAYKDDEEALAMLSLLMAEYSLKRKISAEALQKVK